MDKVTEERLRKEAEFQDQRTQNAESGGDEARSKFYFLMENAQKFYSHTLFDQRHDGKRVVVVGCSTGSVTPLARLGAETIGIDISPVSIDSLNNSIREAGLDHLARAEVMNAEDLDFEDDSVDVICCSGVLHHLDVEKAISNWAKVLNKGGRVRMMEPMAMNPMIAVYRHFTPEMRTEDEHPLLPKDIKILKEHFNEVEVTGFALTSLMALIWAVIPDVLRLKNVTFRALEKLDKVLLKAFPFLIYLCWAVVIEARDPKSSST